MKRFVTRCFVPILVLCFLLAGSVSARVQAKSSDGAEALNFLVVDSSYVEDGETQNIIASIGQGKETLTDVVLTYRNTTTGKLYQQKAQTVKGDAVLFSMTFQKGSQDGAYMLNSISYKEGGKTKTIDLSGQKAGFGVNTEVEVQADAYITDLDTEVETNVVTIDETGEQISDVSIAEAIEAAVEEKKNSNLFSRIYGKISGDLNQDGKVVIVLDPGHGGGDGGTSRVVNGVRYIERDINLKIAQFCKAEMERLSDAKVYMTRTDNTSKLMDRKERTNFALSVKADVIVSLHINATEDEVGQASGALVYCPEKNTESGKISQALADEILKKLELLGLQNRGTTVREDLGMILYPKQNGVPGILVEHCFINNPDDVKNHLSTEEQIKAMGVADAHGILEYFTMDQLLYYEPIFNPEYYAGRYGDLKKAYGDDKTALLSHFLNYGMKEGRQGCEGFDVHSYRNQYADLRRAYGNDLKSYYTHYLKYGQREKRKGTGCTTLQGAVTVYNGIDYSAIYNYQYYIDKYGDIKRAYGGDDAKVLQHFVNYGMKEGRQGCESFNVSSYRNQYADLRQAYGNNLKSYYLHYLNYGIKEKRKATGCTTLQNPVTTYKGVNYEDVYDYSYYMSNYSSIASSVGNDDMAVLEYFVNTGMSQGHQAKDSFDVQSYKNLYSDLRNAYGSNLKSYYMHYINYGKKEERKATGCTLVKGAVTVYGGVDYSAVYNYEYYVTNYSDIMRAFGNDDLAVLRHFVNYGMREGRQASENFNVHVYRAKNGDLQNAYGDDLKSYYTHYLRWGMNEGRECK